MLKKILVLFCLVSQAMPMLAQPLAIGDWRFHASYGNVHSIAFSESENTLFAASNNAMFSYDLNSEEIQRYNKVNGLSDVRIQQISYAESGKTLIISYQNGNIDLLKDGDIVNISALERSTIANSKIINNVLVLDSMAYLSCSFGIMALDVLNEIVRATYIIGDNGTQTQVYDLAMFDGNFWAATDDGLKKANPVNANLQNFELWETVNIPSIGTETIKELEIWNNALVISTHSSIYKGDGNTWNLLAGAANTTYKFLDGEADKLAFYEEKIDTTGNIKRYVVLDKDENPSYYESEKIAFPNDLYLSESGDLWAGDKGFGVLHFESPSKVEQIVPAGPYSEKVFDMDAGNGKLWVATGAYNSAFNYLYNRDGALKLENSYWSVLNEYTQNAFQDFLDIVRVKMHPDPSRKDVYFGSFYDGLIHFDGENYKHYNSANSPLKTRNGDTNRTVINGLGFDEFQNLWMTSYDTEYPISVFTAEEEWVQFKPRVTVVENSVTNFVFDDIGQVWFLIQRSNDQGILVLNHGNTLEDPSDDVYRILRSGEGLGNLPSNQVKSIAKDKNGEIWVGTEQGLAVFYCPTSALTSSGCDAQQIFLEQDGLGAYLLAEQSVSAIAVDAGNRKWIGTSNGVWLFSADGSVQLEYFNSENSPLPSNNILSIAIDDASGEVFIGTELGIISFKGEATKGEEKHTDVLVYPNPVHPDYEGPIAVKGLVEDAKVKFTDVSGRLIYETTAFGGQAIWNGRNPNGQRAKSGVYLVFSANADGSEKYVAKFVLIK